MAALVVLQIAFREWKGTWSAYKKNSPKNGAAVEKLL